MQWVVYLVSGLVAGGIYAIFACGLTLIYSSTGIYNLAFGSFAYISGLTFYELFSAHMERWLAFLIVLLVWAPVSAVVFERGIFRRLAGLPEAARLVGTVAVLLGLPALAVDVLRWLADAGVDLPDVQNALIVPGIGPEPPRIFKLSTSAAVNSDQLIVIAATLVLVAALTVLINRTRIGLMTRAVVDRPELASMRGVDPAFTSRFAWISGSILASTAGVVSGPLFGLNTSSLLLFVVASSGVVVLAGFRSLPIAAAGGLALGAVSSLLAGAGAHNASVAHVLNTVPGLRGSVVFVVLLLALLWRGKDTRRAAGSAQREHPVPQDFAADLPRWRRRWPWVVATVAVGLWAMRIVPVGALQAGPVERNLIMQALAMSLAFLSITVVVGLLGVASLAQAALVTTGALTAGYVAAQNVLGGGFVVGVVAGTLAAAVLAVLIALPALWLGGLALALATLALGYIGDQIIFTIPQFTNTGAGWRLDRPHALQLDSDRSYLILCAVILALALAAVTNVTRSRSGRAMLATRFSRIATLSVGTSANRAIIEAFLLSGGLAGLGGALYTYGVGSISPTTWPTATGLLWVTIALIQGVRRPGAAVVSGFVSVFFTPILRNGFWGITPAITDPNIPVILFGLSALILVREPDGALQQMSRANFLRRERRRKRAATGGAALREADHTVGEPAASGRREVATVSSRSQDTTAPGSSGPVLLRLQDVVAGYGESVVLRGLSIEVPAGSIVGVLGPNGAGKSTLCGLLAGTVPARDGTVEFDGRDVTMLPAHHRARAGLLVSPESRGIFPNLTVAENLAVWLADSAKVEEAIAAFPALASMQRRHAGDLSGGEQQMLALAPLFARPPKLLVGDEVTLGLAPRIVEQILAGLQALRGRGTAVLLVDERPRRIAQIFDYSAVLNLGRIVYVGAADEASTLRAERAYLGDLAVRS